jgi:excisionase family DNA binding protein
MTVTKLLSVPEFARATGLGYQLARKLVLSGEIPSIKVGARRRVDIRWVHHWLSQATPGVPVDGAQRVERGTNAD